MLKIPRFIGHRGAAGFAPENTIAAMRIAKQCGAKMVEFDVKQTKDGVLIIIHDDNVQRTTNGIGNIADLTIAEMRKLNAGSWFDASFDGEKVPTLDEVFHVLDETNMMANIEIKPCPGTDKILTKNVVNFVKNYWPSNLPPPLVSSFSMECLRIAREESPHLNIGLLFDDPIFNDWKILAHELRPSAICLNHKSLTSPVLVEEIHKENLVVLVYTVNDMAHAQMLYEMGVDSIFTDYPGVF